jgi:hypothetical protein
MPWQHPMMRSFANPITERQKHLRRVHGVFGDLSGWNLACDMHDQWGITAFPAKILGDRAHPNESQELFSL